MRALRRFLSRLINLATGHRRDERLKEELESHIAHLTAENIRAGMSPDEAARASRLKLGAVESLREQYRSEESLPLVENLLLDLRYVLRVLRKSPAFTITAVITLMLGIGTNVVVFSVLNAVLLHPLSVNDPQSLYQIRHQQWMIGRLLTTSYPDFEDLRRRNSTFSGMIAINAYSHARLTWHNTTVNINGDEVTGNYFDLLGIQPRLGRVFHAAEEHGPNSTPYLVLSDALWRRVFQADPNIVGATVELNRQPFTVVGVIPAQFHGTERFAWPDYWIPMANEAQTEGSDYLQNRSSVDVTVIGRLKPGVMSTQATEDLNAIVAQLAKEYPTTDENTPLRLIHPGLIGDEGDVIRGFLYGVTVLALLVLAAACANLASLFAARTVDRSRELALRMALGSSRRRLVSQLLTEVALLSLAGGAAGFGLAHLLLGFLNHWQTFIADHLEISVDTRVYLVGFAFTCISAFLFGLAPARQVWRSTPLQSLGREPMNAGYFGRFSLRDILLGLQIAICTLLVTSSLVAVGGLTRALHVPLGFNPQSAMFVDLDLSQITQDDAATLQHQKSILEAIRQIPGTTAVGAVNRTPFTGGLHPVPVFRPGTTEFKLSNSALAPYIFQISPGYFEAAGTRLLQGRDVSWTDTTSTPSVAVVNQTFAQKMWGQTSPIGQHFILQNKLTEVVGIAEDGKYHDLEESPQPVVFQPISQNLAGEAIFVVRSPRSANEMAAALQQTLNSIAPDTSLDIQSWTGALESELFPARVATVALGVMGLLAAMLAITGIFGMAAYIVSRRMRELGIRVALGARKPQVMRAALGRPAILLFAGSILGLLAGILARPLLGQIVYQANPLDPIVILGVVLTMSLLGLAASAIPARRALAADPSALMREE